MWASQTKSWNVKRSCILQVEHLRLSWRNLRTCRQSVGVKVILRLSLRLCCIGVAESQPVTLEQGPHCQWMSDIADSGWSLALMLAALSLTVTVQVVLLALLLSMAAGCNFWNLILIHVNDIDMAHFWSGVTAMDWDPGWAQTGGSDSHRQCLRPSLTSIWNFGSTARPDQISFFVTACKPAGEFLELWLSLHTLHWLSFN